MNKQIHQFYFDTEFTGLRNGTELISIGVLLNEKYFYGEIKGVDYNSDEITQSTKEFLSKEVIPGLMFDINKKDDFIEKTSGNVVVFGDKTYVANEFVHWLNINMRTPEDIFIPVSDVMYYDMVLLMDLINSADKNPISESVINSVSPAGIDINYLIIPIKHVNHFEAFDVNREELLKELIKSDDPLIIPGKKHNSLYDARVIKALYDVMTKKLRMRR